MKIKPSSMPVIDVDSHYVEPPNLWIDRAPANLRDQAPHVIRKSDGTDAWFLGDGTELCPMGYAVISNTEDAKKVYGTLCLDTYEDIHPAGSYAEPRLKIMDQFGILYQILFPNVLGFTGSNLMKIGDLKLRNFCVTAYNDALAELQKESNGRILGQFVLPVWDIDATVHEFERCINQLGLKGFVLSSGLEEWGLPMLNDSHWDPLLNRAQEAHMPVNFHIGGGGVEVSRWVPFETRRGVVAASTLSFLSNISCLVNLITSGILDRFPRLNFISVESGFGWLNFMLESLEYQWNENKVSDIKCRPREYFERQLYSSFWFEDDAETAVNQIGPNNIMFETDFPHPTCLYPDVKEHIDKTLGGLDESVQRKILYETAADIYNLEVPVQ